MSKPFSPIATSSHDIVMQMLSVICQTFLPHCNQLSRYCHENAVSYMSKPFSTITTSSHDIVMKMQKETINTQKSLTSVSYSNCENVMKDDKRVPLFQCRSHVLIITIRFPLCQCRSHVLMKTIRFPLCQCRSHVLILCVSVDLMY